MRSATGGLFWSPFFIVDFCFNNNDGACLATEETGCTLLLDNLGGQGFTVNDVNITLSDIKKYGTVAEITKSPTFIEAQAAA